MFLWEMPYNLSYCIMKHWLLGTPSFCYNPSTAIQQEDTLQRETNRTFHTKTMNVQLKSTNVELEDISEDY